jgi:hypothetical protein
MMLKIVGSKKGFSSMELAARLVGSLVGYLVDWPVGRLVGWSVGRSAVNQPVDVNDSNRFTVSFNNFTLNIITVRLTNIMDDIWININCN